jgi:hypothetical protein
MSHYWNCHPELYTEIIFKEMIRRGLCNDFDDIEETVENFKDNPEFSKVATMAEGNYWADKIDEVCERRPR